MTELTLETLQTELAPLKTQLDGLPIINRSLVILQQQIREILTAINEALHYDVNKVQAQNVELETRIITLERLITELKEEHS